MYDEAKYVVKAAAWKMLDYANPAWAPVDYAGHGKNMQADFSLAPNEPASAYWARAHAELIAKRRALT